MASSYVEKRLNIFTSKMQIKAIVRFHLIPVRMAIIKRSTQLLMRVLGKMNLYSLLVGVEISSATMEISRRFLKKLNLELSYEPTTSLWYTKGFISIQ